MINTSEKALISGTYCTIAKTKSAWKHELGEEFVDNWWVNVVNRIH